MLRRVDDCHLKICDRLSSKSCVFGEMSVLCVIVTEQSRVDRWTADATPNLGIDH